MAREMSRPRPHALAHALPRSSGFALLRPASRPQLDATRIVTMSGTLAINLIAMGLLMMPMAMPPPATWDAPTVRHPVRVIEKEKEKPVVVKIVEESSPPKPVTQPVHRQTLAPAPTLGPSTPLVTDTGTDYVANAVASEDIGPTTDFKNEVSSAPTAMQLEYRSAPAPKYPRGALLRKIEGTVLLQVLVGIDGRPLDVTVSQSSGNRELDEAARQQILKRWSFQPAMKNGQAVQAIGLVPVAFNLRR